jgi:hypothetical protein
MIIIFYNDDGIYFATSEDALDIVKKEEKQQCGVLKYSSLIPTS